jgi:hypothetical protein
MKAYILLALIMIAAGCIRQVQYQGHPANNFSTIPVNIPAAEEAKFDYSRYDPPESISHPVILRNPVVMSPMPYYIFNDSEVNAYKYNITLENIRIAFGMWENATKGKVKFVRSSEKEGIVIYITPKNYYTYDIQPGAIRQEVAGEASPVYYKYPNHSVIVGGEITVGPLYGTLENRVQIMHEIGHIMGFAHSNNSHSVLFPVVAYSQEITPDIIESLDTIYGNVFVQ